MKKSASIVLDIEIIENVKLNIEGVIDNLVFILK